MTSYDIATIKALQRDGMTIGGMPKRLARHQFYLLDAVYLQFSDYSGKQK